MGWSVYYSSRAYRAQCVLYRVLHRWEGRCSIDATLPSSSCGVRCHLAKQNNKTAAVGRRPPRVSVPLCGARQGFSLVFLPAPAKRIFYQPRPRGFFAGQTKEQTKGQTNRHTDGQTDWHIYAAIHFLVNIWATLPRAYNVHLGGQMIFFLNLTKYPSTVKG
jgi:hypothetical protein